MDFRNRASSNFSPNIVSETGSTGFVEVLVRLQAEATGDDFFWISVVPPKIECARLSAQARFSLLAYVAVAVMQLDTAVGPEDGAAGE